MFCYLKFLFLFLILKMFGNDNLLWEFVAFVRCDLNVRNKYIRCKRPTTNETDHKKIVLKYLNRIPHWNFEHKNMAVFDVYGTDLVAFHMMEQLLSHSWKTSGTVVDRVAVVDFELLLRCCIYELWNNKTTCKKFAFSTESPNGISEIQAM